MSNTTTIRVGTKVKVTGDGVAQTASVRMVGIGAQGKVERIATDRHTEVKTYWVRMADGLIADFYADEIARA